MKTIVREPSRWLRRSAPRPVTHAGRDAYRRFAALTAQLRPRPDFILVGAQRCGTTSLFRALAAHPCVVPPSARKGINYFDLNYYRGPRWYHSHFPLERVASYRATRHGGRPVVFEASGYYLYHPWALERAARDLPTVKLVAILRNPVERAFSAYKHEFTRGYETETFERALTLEDERLHGEAERMRDDPAYESLAHRHHSYRHRGHYADQLERALRHFPAAQLHVLDSEAYFADPGAEYARLLRFLGLPAFEPAFAQLNGHPSAPMHPDTRDMLEDYYRPHDARLAKLLARPLEWAR